MRPIVVVVVLLGAIVLFTVRKRAQEREVLERVTGTFEYQYPPSNLPWTLRSTLVIRPDGRWVRENDFPDHSHEHSISYDSGSFQFVNITLALRSEIEYPPSVTTYTVSGDTLYERVAGRVRYMERVTGKPFSLPEGIFVRSSRAH
ncbi:MAG: hypothetical protein ACJ785_10860 [Gemmatimonadaceae bacterium]